MKHADHPHFQIIMQALLSNRSKRQRRMMGADDMHDAASDTAAVIDAVEARLRAIEEAQLEPAE